MRNGERGEERVIVCEVDLEDGVYCIVFVRKRSNEGNDQEQE